MIIDILFFILMIMAVIKGYQRGLIVAVFSLLAFVIGLAAALKLSTVTAHYLGEQIEISRKWLPVVSFMLVFVIVVLAVRWVARLIQKTAETLMLGWLNRLGGILVYALTYTIIYSVILFYANQVHLINPETIAASHCFAFITPIGPRVIDAMGIIIPFFRDMFDELKHFFERLSAHAGH